MKVAFLNLCHCDPMIVERVARKLTASPAFDMYIHVDAKQDEVPFRKRLNDCPRVYFVKNRQKVYWGGYHAVLATLELMRVAVESDVNYDYYVLLQNLDYPLKSNNKLSSFLNGIKESNLFVDAILENQRIGTIRKNTNYIIRLMMIFI